MEVQAVAVCKTVGSAYVGSNPTPATTCENGPLAGNSRLGGPFPSCHALYQGVSLRVDVSRCPRTYSGRRRYRSRGRGHRRFSTDGHGRARQRAVQVRCRRYAPPGGRHHFGGAGAAAEGGRAVRQAVAFAAPRERAARVLARVPFQVGLSRCVIHQAGPAVPNPRRTTLSFPAVASADRTQTYRTSSSYALGRHGYACPSGGLASARGPHDDEKAQPQIACVPSSGLGASDATAVAEGWRRFSLPRSRRAPLANTRTLDPGRYSSHYHLAATLVTARTGPMPLADDSYRPGCCPRLQTSIAVSRPAAVTVLPDHRRPSPEPDTGEELAERHAIGVLGAPYAGRVFEHEHHRCCLCVVAAVSM